MEIMLWKLSACIKQKCCFEDFTKLLASSCVSKKVTKESKWIKISCIKFLYSYVMIMETHQRNKSLYLNLNRKLWLCHIKFMTDTFTTHFCLDKCNWGTMKSLEIKIALFCEWFQNRFYFKDLKRELSSWSVRKFWNFWFHCIMYH